MRIALSLTPSQLNSMLIGANVSGLVDVSDKVGAYYYKQFYNDSTKVRIIWRWRAITSVVQNMGTLVSTLPATTIFVGAFNAAAMSELEGVEVVTTTTGQPYGDFYNSIPATGAQWTGLSSWGDVIVWPPKSYLIFFHAGNDLTLMKISHTYTELDSIG